MKIRIYILLAITCFFTLNTNAQNQGDDQIASELYKLIELKNKYGQQLSKVRTNSYEERKKLEETEISKSEYGKTVKNIKANRDKYLTYINKSIKNNSDKLDKEFIDWQPKTIFESRAVDYYFISKLDYLKAVKYSLFDQDSDQLLSLGKIPGIKPRYPHVSSPVRPK